MNRRIVEPVIAVLAALAMTACCEDATRQSLTVTPRQNATRPAIWLAAGLGRGQYQAACAFHFLQVSCQATFAHGAG